MSQRRRTTTAAVATTTTNMSNPSSTRSVQELDRRAVELEKQLAILESSATTNVASSSTTPQEQANALRVQICELLADIVLTNPIVAVQKQVLDRLWRKCFYARLSKLRARVSKEHKKPKSSKQSSTTAVAALEQHLLLFLSEAITLYDYLCDRLWDKLPKLAVTESSSSTAVVPPGASATSTDENSAAAAATMTLAIVECLHRLYLCLGDLHRYSSSSSSSSTASTSYAASHTTTTTTKPTATTARSAEASYLTSSKLGPGYGHPYNQLGVLCGSQVVTASTAAKALFNSNHHHRANIVVKAAYTNPSALGLYWYVRALLATTEPFETSQVNVQRLFQANAEWLQAIMVRHGSDETNQGEAAALSSAGKLPLSHSACVFLAKFVHLHGLLFRFGSAEKGEEEDGNTTSATITENHDQRLQEFEVWFHQVMDGFQTLLNQSALGDSLLLKMVCILAFSECYRHNLHKVTSTTSSWSSSSPGVHRWLARKVTLTIGIHLADRVVTVGQKWTTKSNKPSTRLLLPLWLLIKFVWHSAATDSAGTPSSLSQVDHSMVEKDVVSSQSIEHLTQEFAHKIVTAMNLLTHHASSLEAGTVPLQQAPIKELLELRGFRPFASLLTNDLASGFATAQDAMDILTTLNRTKSSNDSQTSQETSSLKENATTNSMSGSASLVTDSKHNEDRMKVARFLELGNELVDDRDCPQRLYGTFHRSDDGILTFEKACTETTSGAEQRLSEGMDIGDDYDGDYGGDDVQMHDDGNNECQTGSGGTTVLVYQENKSGGPALLVPGAFLPPAATASEPPAPFLVSTRNPMQPQTNVPIAPSPIPAGAPHAAHQDTAATVALHPALLQDSAATSPSAAVPSTAITSTDAGVSRFANPAASAVTGPMDIEPAAMLRSDEPAVSVLPPPGFGFPANPNISLLPEPSAPEPFHSIALGSARTASSFRFPNHIAGSTIPDRALSVLESLNMFDDPSMMPPTLNPFVPTAAPSSRDALQPTIPIDDDHRWLHDVLGSDASSLLDSGLLNSLLQSEENPPSTKNPFAA